MEVEHQQFAGEVAELEFDGARVGDGIFRLELAEESVDQQHDQEEEQVAAPRHRQGDGKPGKKDHEGKSCLATGPGSQLYNDAVQRNQHHWSYSGLVKSYNPDKGYGFIHNEEIRTHFGRDCFLTRAEVNKHQLSVGEYCIFRVKLVEGNPQVGQQVEYRLRINSPRS